MELNRLTPWLAPWVNFLIGYFRVIKIDFRDGRGIQAGDQEISGSYKLLIGGDFALFHRIGEQYYPQGQIHFNPTQKTWTAEMYVAEQLNYPYNRISLVVAEINPAFRLFVDYWWDNRLNTAWKPIIIKNTSMPGFKILHQVDLTWTA